MDGRNDKERRNAASGEKRKSNADMSGAKHGKASARRKLGAEHKEKIMDIRAQDYSKFKLKLIFCVVLLFFAIFCGRILYEQNVNGEEYHRLALTQLINGLGEDRTITASRGDITDRNMTTIASSTTVYDVFLDIKMLMQQDENERGTGDDDDDGEEESTSLLSAIVSGIKGIFSGSDSETTTTTTTTTSYTVDDTVEAICEIFELEEDEVRSWLTKEDDGTLTNNTYYYVFAKEVSYEKMKAFEDLQAETDEDGNTKKIGYVYFEESSKRTYIYSTLASSVIGFTRGDNSWGLERTYSDLLTGEDGRSFRYIDANGDIATETVASTDGATLITTLDANLQEFAEELVERYSEEYQAENGGVIVMDPDTGEVIVMAQYPSFDLNDPTNFLLMTDSSYSEYVDADSATQADVWDSVWENFNLTYTFEPGSIFKPVTVAAALEEGVIDENTYTYYCTGSVTVADYTIKCANSKAHGAQTLEQCIANSCNCAMIDIAQKTGRSTFLTYQKDFGYGSKTGIDLPAEGTGILFSESELNSTELATSAFGQRFTCTPIQAINSICAIINGGNVLKPYIVSKAVDADGNILLENTTTIERKVISQDVSDFLREAMQKVVTEGTGTKAAIEGYNIGGKSGTAELGVADTDSWEGYALSFVGYFPVEDPQYVVLVTLNKVPSEVYGDGLGHTTVAPMFREMAAEIISYKGIQPSYDVEGGSSLTENTIELSDYVDRSITDVIEELNSNGIEYEILGSAGDTVTKQYPEAGTQMSLSGVVYLTIGGDTEDLVTVPDVVGNDLTSAGKLLNDYGFVAKPYVASSGDTTTDETEDEASVESETSETDSGSMTVIRQVPDAGVKLPAGTEIRLEVQ